MLTMLFPTGAYPITYPSPYTPFHSKKRKHLLLFFASAPTQTHTHTVSPLGAHHAQIQTTRKPFSLSHSRARTGQEPFRFHSPFPSGHFSLSLFLLPLAFHPTLVPPPFSSRTPEASESRTPKPQRENERHLLPAFNRLGSSHVAVGFCCLAFFVLRVKRIYA